MLSAVNFTQEYIRKLQKESGADPSIIERTVFAFGLLEAITLVHMPFIFKGGTSLMLLLSKPMRLSTDIDIVVAPGTDVVSYVQKARKIFPFHGVEEDIRIGRNHIEKRHFRFFFTSPMTGKEFNVLLDIVFENNPYIHLIHHEINNSLLVCESKPTYVDIPDKESVLGDKLTAFAPHTTGITFDQNKDLEIMKQFYDCWCLSKETEHFDTVAEVYRKISLIESAYRGLSIMPEDSLKDTMRACLCIIARGALRSDEYKHFSNGIKGLQGHLFTDSMNGERAAVMACRLLYLTSCIKEAKPFQAIARPDEYSGIKLSGRNARKISYIRNIDPEAYGFIIETFRQEDTVDIF